MSAGCQMHLWIDLRNTAAWTVGAGHHNPGGLLPTYCLLCWWGQPRETGLTWSLGSPWWFAWGAGWQLPLSSMLLRTEQITNAVIRTVKQRQNSKVVSLISHIYCLCTLSLGLCFWAYLSWHSGQGEVTVAAVLMLYSFISDFCSFVYRSRRNLCSLHFFWDLNALYTSFKLQQPSNIEAPPNQCYLFWERVHFGFDFAFVSLGAAWHCTAFLRIRSQTTHRED